MTALEVRLSTYVTAVDADIERLFSTRAQYRALYDMLRYHLGWLDASPWALPGVSGKRLRPALCLLVADALGKRWNGALPSAVAVELVHNFSLVHDDIEDQSALRRHRPTVWSKWGMAQGINAGDALLILAEQALAEAAGMEPAVAIEALRLLNRACRGLCEGQHLDLLWENEASVSVDQYLEMIERKTARLFECAAQLGALCAGASWEAQRQSALFGSSLGMAFQALDDLLGVWGPEAETGKTADLDVANRKKTLPVVLGLSAPDSLEAYRLRALFSLDRQLTPTETAEATGFLEQLGVRECAIDYVRRYRDEALAHLDHPSVRDRSSELRAFTEAMLPATEIPSITR